MFLKRHFGPDRRRRRRQLLNTSVRVLSENGSLEALGINISDVGMSLFTIANLEIDSRIQPLIEKARVLKEHGREGKIKELEQSAESLGQKLKSVSEKLLSVTTH